VGCEQDGSGLLGGGRAGLGCEQCKSGMQAK
jgi:hypothetical protein